MNIYSSSSHNYPKQEPTQKSFSKWMDKQTMVHPYNGTLSNKEEWTTDTVGYLKDSKTLGWVK